MAACKTPFQCLIECPVCFTTENIPKLLPCQHTVCELCLTSIQKTNNFSCPICREDIIIPENGLPNNLTILQLTDMVRSVGFQQSHDKKTCEFCGLDGKFVSQHCNICDENFCQDCSEKHRNIIRYKDHVTLPMSMVACREHQRGYMAFCETCNTILCSVCIHREPCCNHSISNLEDLREEKLQAMQRIIDIISANIQMFVDKVEPAKLELENCLTLSTQERANIKQQTNRMKDMLDDRERHLLDEVDKYQQDIMMKQSKIEDNEHLNSLCNLKEMAETAVAGGIEQTLLILPVIQVACMESEKVMDIDTCRLIFKMEDSMRLGEIHFAASCEDTCNSSAVSNVHTSPTGEIHLAASFEDTCNKRAVSPVPTRPTPKHLTLLYEKADITNNMWDVTFVNNSRVAVTDCHDKKVILIDMDSVLMTRSGKHTKNTKLLYHRFAGTKCFEPHGISYHSIQDSLLICNHEAGCICLLDPLTLHQKRKLKLKSVLPSGIAVLSNGHLVVTDTKSKKVSILDMDGKSTHTWNASRNVIPVYVTVDEQDHIYVADFVNSKIVKLSSTGKMLSKWNTTAQPSGLTVWNNKLLITEGYTDCLRSVDTDRNKCILRQYSLHGIAGEELLRWDCTKGFGHIRSVTVSNGCLAVLGSDGIRVYKLNI